MRFNNIVFILLLSCLFLQCNNKDGQKEMFYSEINDSQRFVLDYPLVGNDNIFIYRNVSEAADILENGRGIVFLGFKECPWCQLYAVFLHEVALEMGFDIIYYCDIREDRQNNSESYQRIIRILTGHLQYDDEGRQRVYVPDVSIVSRGRIIARDFETSKETLGYSTPQEYWNVERVNALKERLRAGMSILNEITSRSCSDC